MCKNGKRNLTAKQAKVIDGLFEESLDESKALTKYKVSKNVYRKWLAQREFIDEIAMRVESSRRQTELIIAKYAPTAAAKLVGLMDSEKEETSRKACLDIIETVEKKKEPAEKNDEPSERSFTAEQAGRLLAALAREK